MRGLYPLGYVEGLNDAKTLLAYFFSILLEVNLEGEATEVGFLPDEHDGVMLSLWTLPHVAAKGLMAIPPPTSDPDRLVPTSSSA